MFAGNKGEEKWARVTVLGRKSGGKIVKITKTCKP